MVSFINFAKIASICVGFHLGTLHGYFFVLRVLTKFEFPPRISNKTCLNKPFLHILDNFQNAYLISSTRISAKLQQELKTNISTFKVTNWQLKNIRCLKISFFFAFYV